MTVKTTFKGEVYVQRKILLYFDEVQVGEQFTCDDRQFTKISTVYQPCDFVDVANAVADDGKLVFFQDWDFVRSIIVAPEGEDLTQHSELIREKVRLCISPPNQEDV